MDKIIAVVFNNEHDAYTGVKVLEELHEEGSITLYGSGVIKKQLDGHVTLLEESPQGPVGSGVGLLTGSLLGLLGGPVGAVVGGAIGFSGGIFYDLAQLGIGEDFLYDVGRTLLPGKAAVVAEIWEEWVTPVNSRMEAAGGIVFRRSRSGIIDTQIERDLEVFDAEIDELEAEIKTANAETKAKLQAKLDETKAKLRATQERAKAAVEKAEKETDEKANSLVAQIAKANAETKAKIEKRLDEMKAEHKLRTAKLRKAGHLIKEAAAI